MWSWLASLISGPIIKGALDAYNAKLKAGNTTDKIAADLAMRELDVQVREVEAQSALKIAEVGRWYEPEKLFAYVTLVFYAKVLLWIKCWHSAAPMRWPAPLRTGRAPSWRSILASAASRTWRGSSATGSAGGDDAGHPDMVAAQRADRARWAQPRHLENPAGRFTRDRP